MRPVLQTACVIALVVSSASLALAEKAGDRVQIGRDIVVEANDKTNDLVCIGCSIRVYGQTAGDVVAIAGSVTLEQGAQVAGDTTAVLGDVRLNHAATIAGSVTAVGGMVHRDPSAAIAGDVTSMGGAGWLLLVLLPPFLLLGGMVALIVWLLRRNRPNPAAAYPTAQPTMRS